MDMIVRLVRSLLAGMGATRAAAWLCGPGQPTVNAAVIVAHPDDETLWAGGEILAHPEWNWFILALCRGGDPDRAPRYWRAIDRLEALGNIADLDDGPEQEPLQSEQIRQVILAELPEKDYDLILTHGPRGEYTRHRRHEETSRAVMDLWRSGKISARSLVLFAYEDGGRAYLPRPRPDAHFHRRLSETVWQKKHEIITEVYGFAPDSWEARTTPREEAFWRFDSPSALRAWLVQQGMGQG